MSISWVPTVPVDSVRVHENLQGDANKMEDTLLKEIKELQKQLNYHKIEIFTNLKYAKGKSRYDDYYYNDNNTLKSIPLFFIEYLYPHFMNTLI